MERRVYWNNGNLWVVFITATPAKAQEIIKKDMAREALSYCLERWLGTYKYHLVYCYVDLHFHASTTNTSRLEENYFVVKCWIGLFTKKLPVVWDVVKLVIDCQLDEI
jgi:hypothetical protein